MAEIVEQQLQDMIPEFEELERLGFLTPTELKQLIKKRRQFEYKLCKRKKELQDFFEYVIYESNLLELLASRRKKLQHAKKFFKTENSISHRVGRKLHLMTCLWPAHPRVWEFRLSFAKARSLFEEVSTIYAEKIRFHGNDINVWISWAQWESRERKNFEKGRQILLSRAPLYHPKSILLNKEYFRLELLYIDNLKKYSEESKDEQHISKIPQENRDKILNCAIPEVIFKNSLKEFNSAELCQHLFWIAHEFDFAHRLRDQIFREMVQKFPNDIHLWKLKAQLLMKDFTVDETKLDTIDEIPTSSDPESDPIEYSSQVFSKVSYAPKGKLTSLFTLYDEALSSVGSAYLESVIDDLFKILNEVWASEEFQSLISKKILDIFETYSSDLSAKHFLLWYELASKENLIKDKLKNILELGAKKFSSCQHLQLALLPFSSKTETLKRKKKIIENLSGKIGADICFQLISDTKVNLQKVLLERACNHTDSTMSKTMRVRHLENIKELKKARVHYEKYRNVPPFSWSLHTTMLKKELEELSISVIKVRQIFDTCIQQFGERQMGLWLSYIEFERKFGSAKNVSRLKEEALKQLNSQWTNDFIDNKIYLESLGKKVMEKTDIFIVDSPEILEEGKHEFWNRSTLPNLLQQEPVITYEAEMNKNKFFRSLTQIEAKFSGKTYEPSIENEKKDWEEIISILVGHKIALDVKKVDLKEFGLDKEIETFIGKVENKARKMNGSEAAASVSALSKETKKILESSEVLNPEFHNQKQLIPYYLSRNSVKRHRKMEKLKDKGKDWFNMKAPEITEELRRDLKVLKMRSVLDPHHHYKRSDMKVLPKYFQMGKVIDSPLDFFSSRIPKKQRKRTIAEEIMNSEEVLRYQKKKCSEIMEVRKTRTMKRKMASTGKRNVKKQKKEMRSNK
ncbi:UNVERIFIED_CONTAM: hypothetical protein RMT77_017278 [Armadillidium vulgare]